MIVLFKNIKIRIFFILKNKLVAETRNDGLTSEIGLGCVPMSSKQQRFVRIYEISIFT